MYRYISLSLNEKLRRTYKFDVLLKNETCITNIKRDQTVSEDYTNIKLAISFTRSEWCYNYLFCDDR
jgi:hypothetical protein